MVQRRYLILLWLGENKKNFDLENIRGTIRNMKKQRIDWYLKAKFGLFLHWGAYAAGGVEASWPIMAPGLSEAMFRVPSDISEVEYVSLPKSFNPVEYNPRKWVEIAADAGMRYIVMTAKHHDGFCMFDAPGTDYKITNTPCGRDICAELADACRELNMPLGFYYSPPDMNHPGYRDTRKPMTKNWTGEPKRAEWNDYLDYMDSHIRKLLTDYGHISLIWFDGIANHGKYNPRRFHDLVHELSPDTLINDRLGPGFDFVTPEQFIPKKGIPARDMKTPSGMDPDGDWFFRLICSMFGIPGLHALIKKKMGQYADGELELSPVHQEAYPSPEHFQPWETCMTIGSTWAYNPAETAWKEPSELIMNLISVVCRGGNYLLDIGPTDKGLFPAESVERLEYIGNWMKKYKNLLYSCTYSPLEAQTWGCTALSGGKLILFVSEWPENGILRLESFSGKIREASLYGSEALDFRGIDGAVEFTVPKAPADPDISVITADIDEGETIWTEYSEPVDTRKPHAEYLRGKAVSCGWINSLLNGLLAFILYRKMGHFSFSEIAIDVLITVGIIVFVNAWILADTARKDYAKGLIRPDEAMTRGLKLPANSIAMVFVVMIAVVVVFGGIIIDGVLLLMSPGGLSVWAYIILKTLYTGVSAAVAAILSVKSTLKRAYSVDV